LDELSQRKYRQLIEICEAILGEGENFSKTVQNQWVVKRCGVLKNEGQANGFSSMLAGDKMN
jgi:hypothetical protein